MRTKEEMYKILKEQHMTMRMQYEAQLQRMAQQYEAKMMAISKGYETRLEVMKAKSTAEERKVLELEKKIEVLEKEKESWILWNNYGVKMTSIETKVKNDYFESMS